MRNLRADERMSIELRSLYQRHGYLPYRVNQFEEYDLYMRNKRFLISEHVLAFSDMDGKLMALKPDVTLSIVKNTKDSADTTKVSYAERVYRVPRGEHRFKEIMQTGLEVIGRVDDYTMGEVLALAAGSLQAIGPRWALDVADLDIVSGILEPIEESVRAQMLALISEKNLNGLRALCRAQGVGERTAAQLCSLITVSGPFETTLPVWERMALPDACREALCGLRGALEMAAQGCAGRINIDFSVVNDMRYYNGLIFTGFVEGVPTSVLSGGRYDRLMRRMGRSSQAMGFAVYLDQLGRLLDRRPEADVDLLITYTEATDRRALLAAAREATAAGESVRVQRAGETAVRSRRTLSL